jgi:hypothetical protein
MTVQSLTPLPITRHLNRLEVGQFVPLKMLSSLLSQ